jgi:hypothetical protein
MFANSQMGGMDVGSPDTCWVTIPPAPPVSTPFLNQAMGPTAVPAQVKVLILAAPAHNLNTKIPVTIEIPPAPPGVGACSGTFMGPSRHSQGSSVVVMVGSPATRLSHSALQNSNNCQGHRVVPSQFKVMVMR